mmetsp:Transcript_30327/g.97931  ORF Transcript_30327/g.97931 Transcript_30327/m.97931 type:complete len:362 (+) Transcript_30327:976-2061(+)
MRLANGCSRHRRPHSVARHWRHGFMLLAPTFIPLLGAIRRMSFCRRTPCPSPLAQLPFASDPQNLHRIFSFPSTCTQAAAAHAGTLAARELHKLREEVREARAEAGAANTALRASELSGSARAIADREAHEVAAGAMAGEIARLSSQLAEVQSALEKGRTALGYEQASAMQAGGIAACELAIILAELRSAERESTEAWEGVEHALKSASCAAADANAKAEGWAKAQGTAEAEAKAAAAAAAKQLDDALRRALVGESEARREREHAEASNEAIRSLTQKNSLELSRLRAQLAQERAKGETERAATQNEITARLNAVCAREAQMASAMGKVSRSHLEEIHAASEDGFVPPPTSEPSPDPRGLV